MCLVERTIPSCVNNRNSEDVLAALVWHQAPRSHGYAMNQRLLMGASESCLSRLWGGAERAMRGVSGMFATAVAYAILRQVGAGGFMCCALKDMRRDSQPPCYALRVKAHMLRDP